MLKKIFYWSPHINSEVATVKAVFNSAQSLSIYSKKYKPYIINVFGEWNLMIDKLKKYNIPIMNIYNFKLNLPINGFIKSRIFYLILSILVFFPIIKLIKKEKPDYLIIHLINIPVLLASFFLPEKTKIILRISGFPKLNFFRIFFWKLASKNLTLVFSPTLITKNILVKKNVFDEKKIYLLRDPIIKIREIVQLKKEPIQDINKDSKYIVAIGRLTKQKNLIFLINAFSETITETNNIKLLIIGSGEEEKKIKNLIITKKLQNRVILKKYTKNIFNYLNNSIFFVMSSLWEDPGFVIIEAAICNKLILSSDVDSGPNEFIDNNKNGILFKSNDKKDFIKKMHSITSIDKKILLKKMISAKYEAKNYTIFSHYKNLEKYLEKF